MTHIDSLIIGIYLLITIIVGIYAGRGVKTMNDFAVGNRDFLTVTLVMTIFATYVDGEMILNDTKQFYDSGSSYLLALMGTPISMFIYGLIAVKVASFKDAISVGDIMNRIYGRYAQVFTGISGFLFSTAFVAGQFKALSFVFDYFYQIDSTVGVFLSAAILIAYSAFGGIRAVSWTDVVQFFILVNVVPLVTSVALNKVGGLINIIPLLPETNLSLIPPSKEIGFKYLVYFLAIAVPLCDPPLIQRMLMTQNASQSKKAYYIAAAISIPFILVEYCAGLAATILNPQIDSNNIFLYLIDIGMPIGFKGFAVAGIIAIIMSTADSFMNSAAICFSHDVYKTLRGVDLSDKDELKMTKVATLIIGVFACFIALKFDNLVDIMLYSFVLWGPVVTVPLLAGLYGIKAPKYAFYVAMIAGVSTAVVGNLYGLEDKTYIHELLPALLMNFIFFSGAVLYDRFTNSKKIETV